MNRNRVIAAVVIGVVVLIVVAGVGLPRSTSHQPQANQRTLVTKLGYCGPEDVKPCIVSFNLDSNGDMLVNILVPTSTFPNFYLTISRETAEYRYTCKKAKGSPTSLICSGQELFPGEVLQFRIVSVRDEKVLAEGRFAIIGLLLATPGTEPTETEEPTAVGKPTETSTPFSLEVLTPVGTIPATTIPDPSYPNPSYPNP